MSENSFIIITILAHGSDYPEMPLTEISTILKMSSAGDSGNLGYLNMPAYIRIHEHIQTILNSQEYRLQPKGIDTLIPTFEMFRTLFRNSKIIRANLPTLDHVTAFKGSHPTYDHRYSFNFGFPETKIFLPQMYGVHFIVGMNSSGPIQIPYNTNINDSLGIQISVDGKRGGSRMFLSEIVANVKRNFNVKYVGIIDFSCRSLRIGAQPNRSANLLMTVVNDPQQGLVRRERAGEEGKIEAARIEAQRKDEEDRLLKERIEQLRMQAVPIQAARILEAEQRQIERIEEAARIKEEARMKEAVRIKQAQVPENPLPVYPLKHKLSNPPSTIKELPQMNSEGGYYNKKSKYSLKKRKNKNSKKKTKIT